MTSDATSLPAGRHLVVANVIEEARIGGPQNRIAAVGDLLREDGIETVVIMPDDNSANFIEKLNRVGLSFRALKLRKPSRNVTELLLYLLNFPFDVLRVRAAIKSCGADLVHCNGAAQWKGVIAAALLRRPVVWHLNDTHMPGLIRLVFRPIARWLTTGFIVAGNRVAKYYLSGPLAASKRYLVPAPVDCSRFDAAVVMPESAMSGSGGINILSVGNVSPVKDVLTYVRAAQIVNSQREQQVRFFQVGGQFKTQEKYIETVMVANENGEENFVDFLGAQKDVRPHLRASDIYVCSSGFEASPISVWEALAMGVPVVTTDVGDIADMNREGDFARVVPTGDPDALAAALIALCNDREARERMSANARAFALKNLDLHVCVGRHRDAYHALLAGMTETGENKKSGAKHIA